MSVAAFHRLTRQRRNRYKYSTEFDEDKLRELMKFERKGDKTEILTAIPYDVEAFTKKWMAYVNKLARQYCFENGLEGKMFHHFSVATRMELAVQLEQLHRPKQLIIREMR